MFDWLRRLICPETVAHQHPDLATAARVPLSGAFWLQTVGQGLAQGDLIPECLVPVFPSDFGIRDEGDVDLVPAKLIIVTQSCDLENNKVQFVAFCPICSLFEFEEFNPGFKKKNEWNEVLKGRREGLYLLPSPDHPDSNRDSLVVDFRQIISLPISYVTTHAGTIGNRWRLQSPYLEHFSQALARFFMRVGLPSAIPPFR